MFTVRIENISRRNGEFNIFTGGVRMYCERLPGPAGMAAVTVPGTISRRVYHEVCLGNPESLEGSWNSLGRVGRQMKVEMQGVFIWSDIIRASNSDRRLE